MQTPSHSPQRRHFSRIGFQSDAMLAGGGHRHAGKLIDLSLRGALVDGVNAPWRPGDELLLTVALDGQQEIRIEAQVVHRDQHRIGLRCLRIDLDSITHLRRLVELNLGDESLLNRELGELISAD